MERTTLSKILENIRRNKTAPGRLLAILLLVGIILSCSHSTEPKNSIAGTYSLIEWHASPVPVLYYKAGTSEKWTAGGSLMLAADGYYVWIVRDSVYQPTQVFPVIVTNYHGGGRWTFTGNALTLTDTSRGGTTDGATVQGTLITDDSASQFRRQ